jgi:hypothetical protein
LPFSEVLPGKAPGIALLFSVLYVKALPFFELKIGEIMDIVGQVPSVCLDQALTWSALHLPDRYHSIIKDYKQHGDKYQVRWDWAFAQALHETGYLQFGGDVKPDQNNFAGIGATGNGVPGDSFATISDGVLGHIQHLACYAGVNIPDDDLKKGRTKDCRTLKVKSTILGKATTWEGLTGTWAVDPEYFDHLQVHYRRVFQPREQTPGWYRLVDKDDKKFFVAMSGDQPVFKYPVVDHTLSSLQEACNGLLKAFPEARVVRSDKEMDVSAVPDYQPGTIVDPENGTNPTNNLPTTEPPYFWRASPNMSQRSKQITYIILHNTAGAFWGAISTLCDPNNPYGRVSAHLVIPRSGGEIAALVDEGNAAWHAGSHEWNHCSIGIEIECGKDQRGMTDVQEKLLVRQINHLLVKYNLTPDRVDIHRRVCRSPMPSTPTSEGERLTVCPDLIWPCDKDFLAWRKKWYGV